MDRISDLRTPLCKSLSRDVVEHVAASVAEYPDDIPQLIRLLDDTDNRVAWRAAWACETSSSSGRDREKTFPVPARRDKKVIALRSLPSASRRKLPSRAL